MSKKTAIWLSISAFIAGTAFVGSAFTFKEYKQAPKETLQLPNMPDSVGKAEKFKLEELLNARNQSPYAALGWTTLVPEGDGRMRLAGPAGDPELHTFGTRLRSPKYAKGKLVLHSTSRAQVKINGETKISKNKADSVAEKEDTELTLLPNMDYDIQINGLRPDVWQRK